MTTDAATETTTGTAADIPAGTTDPTFDAIVVGGGSAGLSAALMLGRARRHVLVLDAGAPRNRFAAHMHGVLGRDGTSPLRLLADGRDELARYDVEVRTAEAADAEVDEHGVTVVTSDGTRHRARHLVVTTGLRDELPAVDGLAELWGRGVASCPYCDGWEVRDQRIVVLGTGPGSLHHATLLRQWSEHLTYVVHDAPTPSDDELAALVARGTIVEPGRAARLEAVDGEPSALVLDDGRTLPVDAVFTAPRPVLLDNLLARVGAALTPEGPAYLVDPLGATSVARVWAAGNVVVPFANVPVAMAGGAMAGAGVNSALVQEEVASALAQRVVEAR